MQVIVINATSRQIACTEILSEDDVADVLSEPDFDHVTVAGDVVAIVGAHSLFVPGQPFVEIEAPEHPQSHTILRGTVVLARLGSNGSLGSIDDTTLKAPGWIAHLTATTKFLRPFRTGLPSRPVALTDEARDHVIHHPALQVATLSQEDFVNGPF